MDYILNQALEQIGAGADILDVNVGQVSGKENYWHLLRQTLILKITQ